MQKAIKCGKLFCPQDGKIIKDAVILVDGDIVKDVQDDKAAIPAGYEVIDLSDRFVTPGLIDAHVHVSESGDPGATGVGVFDTVPALTLVALRNAQADLMAGFTTLRDGGSSSFLDVALRNAIDRGEFMGPRLVVSGVCIGSTGGHADDHYAPGMTPSRESCAIFDGADGARRAARHTLKYGADFIKFMATGGVMTQGTTVGAQQLTFEEMKAICEIADLYGVHTATHAHGTNGIKDAIRAGVTSVEHGTLIDDEGIDLMLQRGTYLTPTLIAPDLIIKNGVEAGIAPWVVDKAKAVAAHHSSSLHKCLERGVKISFGTDTGTPFSYHGKQAYEFELMVNKAGFTPIQALTAATLTNSHLLRLNDKIGTLEPGKQADIVAFAGDPTEDIKALTDCRFVMKGGVVCKS